MAASIRSFVGSARVAVINRRLTRNMGGLGSLAAQDATKREVAKIKAEIDRQNGRWSDRPGESRGFFLPKFSILPSLPNPPILPKRRRRVLRDVVPSIIQ